MERFDINDDGVVLYFNNIDADGVRFAIDLVQTAITVSPQPAEIKVFDYYEPSVSSRFFLAQGRRQWYARGAWLPQLTCLAPPINKLILLKTAAFVLNFKLWPL